MVVWQVMNLFGSYCRSLDPTCDKEAIRVVKSMPKWIPGKQNGNNVPVYFTLPVVFKLL